MTVRPKVTVHPMPRGGWGWKMVFRKKIIARNGERYLTKTGARAGAAAAISRAATAEIVDDE